MCGWYVKNVWRTRLACSVRRGVSYCDETMSGAVAAMAARRAWTRVAPAGLVLAALAQHPLGALGARQAESEPVCRVRGRVTHGDTALPGVALVAHAGDLVAVATSTDVDGTYRLSLRAGEYRVTAELTGFDRAERRLSLGEGGCDEVVDLQLALQARATSAVPASSRRGGESGRGGREGLAGQAPAAAGDRFERLAVQSPEGAAVGLETSTPDGDSLDAAARLLLPPGFSIDAPTDAVAVGGAMASVDRGALGDRRAAIGRGEFDPGTGEFAPGFGPFGAGGRGGFEGGGRGDGPFAGGPGGRPGGPGAFQLGGRGGRQRQYPATSTYTFGGSALDSSPYRLRGDSRVDKQPYTRQTFNVSAGGPLKVPRLYDGTGRTNFTVTYGSRRGSDLFDRVRDGADRRDARGRLLVDGRAGGRSGHGPPVPRQPDSWRAAGCAPRWRCCPAFRRPTCRDRAGTSTTRRRTTRSPTTSASASRTTSRPRPAAAGGRGGVAAVGPGAAAGRGVAGAGRRAPAS